MRFYKIIITLNMLIIMQNLIVLPQEQPKRIVRSIPTRTKKLPQNPRTRINPRTSRTSSGTPITRTRRVPRSTITRTRRSPAIARRRAIGTPPILIPKGQVAIQSFINNNFNIQLEKMFDLDNNINYDYANSVFISLKQMQPASNFSDTELNQLIQLALDKNQNISQENKNKLYEQFIGLSPLKSVQKTQPEQGVTGQFIVYKIENGEFNALDESDKVNYLSNPEDLDTSSAIFNLLVKYQWPTNLIYADTFSQEEKNALFAIGGNPENFIRNKIQQIYPQNNYDVMSIPYTIYQLFVINYFLTHLDNPILKNMDNHLYAFFDTFQTSTDQYGPYVHLSEKKDFLTASKAIYNNPYVSQGQFMCNCAFGSYYKKNMHLTWEQIAADLISQIIINYPKNKNKIPRHKGDGFNLTLLQRELQGKNLDPQGIINNLLKCEANAHKNNKAILMRAVNLFKQQIEVNGKTQNIDILDSSIKFSSVNDLRNKRDSMDIWTRGNSYGLFPMTGTFYCIWDMPYFYALTLVIKDENNLRQIKTEDQYFYALLIDKLSYVNKGEENTLFLIPPFSAFTQLWGHDSLYHALSHIAQNPIPQTKDPWDIEGFESTLDPYNTLWIQMDPLEFASRLAQFVSQHGILLKVKKGLNIQTEQTRLFKNLDLASIFYNSLKNESQKQPIYKETPISQ